jgi:hypothetical protein
MLPTGAARAHLQSWVNAAAVIQRGVRSWLFKRRFAELRREQQQQVQQIIHLQALWRGVAVRKQLQREQQAARTIQVRVSADTQHMPSCSLFKYLQVRHMSQCGRQSVAVTHIGAVIDP